ncbi:MAG: hypothetical protein J6S57_02730 [Alphaproteobacteria bacterium]|nr:hypothetical protein [Alphaproteobacteria bacterium]
MQNQRGNFLLQVLLALTLVFSFMPFIAKRLASRDMAAQMYSAKQTIETIYNAARLYVYDKKDKLNYPADGTALVLTDTDLIVALEPYGVPAMGFNPKTSLDQNITLKIKKEEKTVRLCEEMWGSEPCDDESTIVVPVYNANLIVDGGDLKEYQVAELTRMIGSFAKRDGTQINIVVPVESMYTDVVLRKEPNNQVGFLTELRMDGCECKPDDCSCPELDCRCCTCNIDRIGSLLADKGFFQTARFYTLSVNGDNRQETKVVSAGEGGTLATNLNANTFNFYTNKTNVPALNINSLLKIGDKNNSGFVDAGEIVKLYYMDATSINVANEIKMEKFSLDEDVDMHKEEGFHTDDKEKACIWTISGNFEEVSDAKNINLRGDVFTIGNSLYGSSTPELNKIEASKENGMHADKIFADEIMVKEASLSELKRYPDSGVKDVEIDLKCVSRIPDINVDRFKDKTTYNTAAVIIADPTSCSKNTKYTTCGSSLNNNSLIGMIVCSYQFWSRLERRVNMKLCEMAGEGCCPKD